MKATACILLLALCASALGAHPFDDKVDMIVELYIEPGENTEAEGMHVEVLYFYDGFFTSYVELQALDTDKDEHVSRAERDARFKTLSDDLVSTLQLSMRGERLGLAPRFEDFEFVDLSNPDNTVYQPKGMVTRNARIGYTFKFDVVFKESWGRGSHPVELVLADKRIFLTDPFDQLRVFDDRGEQRLPVLNRVFTRTKDANGNEEFHRMQFLWEVKTFTEGGGALPPDTPPDTPETPPDTPETPPDTPETPRVAPDIPPDTPKEGAGDSATRDRMFEMYEQRKNTSGNNDTWVAEQVAKLRDNTASPWIWIVVLFGMFVWGASHAVMPGHGKTLVASYLIGTHGTRSDALFLGVVVTAAHTSGVLLLMGGAWAASEFWPGVLKNPEKQLAEMITLAVGLTILAMGVVLVVKRAGGGHHEHDIFGRHVHPEDDHRHDHGHPHTHAAMERSPDDSDQLPAVHAHVHDHDHHHDHGHDHHHDHGHGHQHHGELDPSRMTRMEVLWLGILGGILPCPSAFVLGLVCFQQRLFAQGLIMVVVFSLGLAVVLSAIGLVLVQTKGYLRERSKQRKSRLYTLVETKLPVIAALVIAMVGMVMVVMAAIRLDLINPRSFTI